MVQNSHPTLVARFAPLSLLRAILRRRTEVALGQLDDRLLSDIGLHRGEIAPVARRVSLSALPKGNAHEFRPSRLSARALARVRDWSKRRKAIQELSSLGDRILRDLGIEPDKIVAFVDGAMTSGSRAGKRPIGKPILVEPMSFDAAVVSPRGAGKRSSAVLPPLVAADASADILERDASRAANDDLPLRMAEAAVAQTQAGSAT